MVPQYRSIMVCCKSSLDAVVKPIVGGSVVGGSVLAVTDVTQPAQ